MRISGFDRYVLSVGVAVLLAGCGGSSPATGAPGAIPQSASSSNHYVYVTNLTTLESTDYASEIEYWPVGSTGNVAPAGVIAGPYTKLAGVQGIVVDRNGEIFVSNSEAPYAILGFAPGSNGDVAPNIDITGHNTRLEHPDGLVLDAAGDLYVANCGSACANGEGSPNVEEFVPGSNGDTAPLRIIAGRKTDFVAPHGIALARNGDIVVVDFGAKPPSGSGTHAPQVDTFAAGTRLDRAPIRVVSGSETGLDGTGGGLGLDANGYYVGSWDEPLIERFATDANGDVQPRAVIEGSATQLECCLDGVITAPDHSVYAVVRGSGSSTPPEIIEFSGRASGNDPPLTNISGSNTGLYVPLWVFVT